MYLLSGDLDQRSGEASDFHEGPRAHYIPAPCRARPHADEKQRKEHSCRQRMLSKWLVLTVQSLPGQHSQPLSPAWSEGRAELTPSLHPGQEVH